MTKTLVHINLVNIRNKIFCKTASLSTVATLQSCQKLDHFQIHNKIFAAGQFQIYLPLRKCFYLKASHNA